MDAGLDSFLAKLILGLRQIISFGDIFDILMELLFEELTLKISGAYSFLFSNFFDLIICKHNR